jgi:8-oxo-dGTP diphosphatase
MGTMDNTPSIPADRPAVRHVVAALIVRNGKILICQRSKTQPMALKWEFPGGKIEPGEQPPEALKRELMEELGIDAEIGPKVADVHHVYRRGNSVALQFFLVERFNNPLENRIFNQFKWANPTDLPRYDFLDADKGLVQDIAAGKII